MAAKFQVGDRVCLRCDLLRCPGTVEKTAWMIWIRWDDYPYLQCHTYGDVEHYSLLDELARIGQKRTWWDAVVLRVRSLVGMVTSGRRRRP